MTEQERTTDTASVLYSARLLPGKSRTDGARVLVFNGVSDAANIGVAEANLRAIDPSLNYYIPQESAVLQAQDLVTQL